MDEQLQQPFRVPGRPVVSMSTRQARLAHLVDARVHVFETRSANVAGELFPVEREAIARAVPHRIEEFRLGRAVARRALSSLGVSQQAIAMARNRGPVWPPDIVGSITHCAGYCAAAVARARDIRSLGIDAERNTALPGDVVDLVTSDAERHWIRTQRARVAADTLIFSIKEAIFKAWSPCTKSWLGFEHAEVTVDLRRGRFTADIDAPHDRDRHQFPRHVDGRCAFDHHFVMATVTIPAAP